MGVFRIILDDLLQIKNRGQRSIVSDRKCGFVSKLANNNILVFSYIYWQIVIN